jgi:hypothetical protein
MARTVRLIALPVALGVVLLGASTASAATISKVGGVLRYDAPAAPANDVTLDFCQASACGTARFTIKDASDAITLNAGSGCTMVGTEARCENPDANYTSVFFNLGSGNDRLRTDSAPGSLPGSTAMTIGAIGGAGNDQLEGGRGNDLIGGGPDNDVVSGRDGNDQLDPTTQDPANDDGDDTLIGGDGRDTVNGGDGIDTVSYDDGRVNGVTVTLGNGAPDDGGPEDDPNPATRDNLIGVENAIGSGLPDVLVGSAGANALTGRGGDDVFDGGSGGDRVDGGDGFDRISYAGRTAGVTVNLGDTGANAGGDIDGAPGARDVMASIEGAIGTEAADNLTAGPGGSALAGQGGNDLITGAGAGDALDGGTGDDTIDGGGGADTYTGGDGNDTIRAADGIPESVNCGPGAQDFALTDATDTRIECELPLPPEPPKTQPTNVTFSFFPAKPKRTTRFEDWKINSVPKNTRIVGKCLTRKGKRCGGKLRKGFTRKKARGSLKMKVFNKTYRAGQKIEIVATSKGFKTKVLTTKIRRNKRPIVVVRCITPPSKKRKKC